MIAEGDDTVVVEGNHYFLEADVDRRYLRPSESHTFCWWKGTASYYDVVVGDEENPDAAWWYPDPMDAARAIEGRIAFWHGVGVAEVQVPGGP